MKNWLVITGLALSLVLLGSAGCAQPAKQTTVQQVKVTRGNLTVTVSGSGTIEEPHELNLTFGVAGRIDKLSVKEGDVVKQGDVIARLETDALELTLTQAKVSYAQAQVAVSQYDLAVSQAAVAVTQAEINLKNAQILLDQTTKTSTLSDLRIAQAQVDTASRDVADSLFTLSKYTQGTPGYEAYQKNVVQAQARLKAAQDTLDAMLGGFSQDEVAVKQKQVTAAEQSLAAARQSLDLTKLNADLAQQLLAAAGLSRDNAQKQLGKAILTAPFAGTIAAQPVNQGDTVLGTTTVAHLVDPGKMDLKVQVDEVDIPGVKPGQRAIVKVDALPDTAFSGNVSYIGLIPKKETGVTLFDVKIALDAAIGTGLRGGMSASADIVTTERSNVLLVPNRALKRDGQGKTVVSVALNGQSQERTVVTGASDNFQTEILSGLQEGEVVIEE